tara:strand:- start:1584 stop:1742 length:159 start_codon:yes stop_codon:yes gene_type:complete
VTNGERVSLEQWDSLKRLGRSSGVRQSWATAVFNDKHERSLIVSGSVVSPTP